MGKCGILERKKVLRGFEPRSLDSESKVLTVTPQDHLPQGTSFVLFRLRRKTH